MIPRCLMNNTADSSRVETIEEVQAFLARMKYAIDNGAKITVQEERQVDNNRDLKYTNKYTLADLFSDENPTDAIKRELKSLTVKDYIRTLKDLRFPNRSELREFGKEYNNKDVYIKVRVEIIPATGQSPVFVMSFHYAMRPFGTETFPYRN